jgi:ditrans,polycis-polyprenyl diphosphate synthase
MSMYLSQFRESLQTSALTTWVSSHLEKLLLQALRQGPVPKHLALVMDGNRRFARKHNISTARGHMLGAEVMEKVRNIYLTFQ